MVNKILEPAAYLSKENGNTGKRQIFKTLDRARLAACNYDAKLS